jgi:hypothetical protein
MHVQSASTLNFPCPGRSFLHLQDQQNRCFWSELAPAGQRAEHDSSETFSLQAKDEEERSGFRGTTKKRESKRKSPEHKKTKKIKPSAF